jgi:WD40 repeat protein
LIVNSKLYLVGAFLSSWKLESAECDGLKPHNHRLKGAIANDVFASLISFDSHGDVVNWDLATGNRNFTYTVREIGAKVLCIALDTAQRRLGIGYSDGRIRIVSAVSGSELCEIDGKCIEKGCVALDFAVFYSQKRILACTGSKSIVMIEDLEGNRTRFVRSFVGHTESVSSAIGIKSTMVLSIGAVSELFLWNVGLPNPLVKFKLPHDPTIGMDLPSDTDRFIVGDVAGYIHFLSKASRLPLSSINVFGMARESPISSLRLLEGVFVTSNMHGYVKVYSFEDLSELRMFRAHYDGVVYLSVSSSHHLIITCGDEHIKLWSMEPFGLIGECGVGRTWQINDMTTWVSDSALEDDPAHFSSFRQPSDVGPLAPTFEEEEEVERSAEIKESMSEEKTRTVEEMLKMLDSAEEVVNAGRRVIMKSRREIESPLYPLTMPRSPRKPRTAVSQGFSAWINVALPPKAIPSFEPPPPPKGKLVKPKSSRR